jgi:DNA topoisomerase VI subunit B
VFHGIRKWSNSYEVEHEDGELGILTNQIMKVIMKCLVTHNKHQNVQGKTINQLVKVAVVEQETLTWKNI